MAIDDQDIIQLLGDTQRGQEFVDFARDKLPQISGPDADSGKTMIYLLMVLYKLLGAILASNEPRNLGVGREMRDNLAFQIEQLAQEANDPQMQVIATDVKETNDYINNTYQLVSTDNRDPQQQQNLEALLAAMPAQLQKIDTLQTHVQKLLPSTTQSSAVADGNNSGQQTNIQKCIKDYMNGMKRKGFTDEQSRDMLKRGLKRAMNMMCGSADPKSSSPDNIRDLELAIAAFGRFIKTNLNKKNLH